MLRFILRQISIATAPSSRGLRAAGRAVAGLLAIAVLLAIAPSLGFAEPAAVVDEAPAASQRVDALGDPLPAGALFRLGTQRFHAPESVHELALSPDEQTVITFGKKLIAWDTATGKERWRAVADEFGVRLPGAAYGMRAIAFTADGQQFYTPGGQGEVIVWNTMTGERQALPIESPQGAAAENAALNGREGEYRAIDVAADGQTLALGGAGGVIIAAASDGRAVHIANRPTEPLNIEAKDRLRFGGHFSFVLFSPDGKSLAIVTSDTPEAIRIVSAQDGAELRRITLNGWLVRLAFSPDGKQIVTTERDNAVRLYDVETARPLWSHTVTLTNPNENYTSAVAFSPDGQFVAACATDKKIHLIDARDGKELAALEGHTWYPWALAFSADGKTLYSSGWDRAVRRWDVAARKQLELPVGTWGSSVVAASPDGRTLACQDGWGTIHLVDARDGSELRTLGLAGTRFEQLKFSPDAQQLAAGGGAGDNVLVVVWDLAGGNVVHRFEWPRGRDPNSGIEALCFSPSGDRLAAAVFRQSSGYLWDLATSKQVTKLAHSQIYGLSFGPDGELATAGWDRTVRFWDGRSGVLHDEIDLAPAFPADNELRMYAVCHAREGGLLATAHLQGKIRVWQADNMALRAEFQVEGRLIYGAISFSPDGLWIATANMQGGVEVWDALTGQRVWSVGRHEGYGYNVAFGRDSRTLLTGGVDGVAYLWDLQPEELATDTDAATLWDDLAGDDGLAAYRAMWQLAAMPADAVKLLSEKLRGVTILVDPDRVTEGDTVEANLRQQELLERWAARAPDVQRSLTVRRALSVLAHIGTPAAVELLKDLNTQNPAGELGPLAGAALERAREPSDR